MSREQFYKKLAELAERARASRDFRSLGAAVAEFIELVFAASSEEPAATASPEELPPEATQRSE